MRLGRQLGLPPLELERIENGLETLGEKTRLVLKSWLQRRGGPETTATPPPRQLEIALRAMDKDVRLFAGELVFPTLHVPSVCW